ncbi:MAG: recombinase RecA [Phycisphaerae bacterium]|nr:recombinase RecA [Phycisphaerae bacterium]
MSEDITAKREQALGRALQQIEKSFGKGAIMRLDDNASVVHDGLSTGVLSLDLALGGYGVPRGRIVELYGPESGGKTTLALHIVASAQQNGGVAAVVDAEHALDPTWAKKCGVKLDQLLVSQPDTGEQALDIVEMLVHSNAVDVIVVDSVAALVPKAELEGEMGQSHVGLQARLMSQSLRKLTGITAKSKCIVIFINQIREKIGVMFGNPETTPGGRALKFYASIRLDIRRVTTIKEGEQSVGNHVRAKVVKNKVAAPFKTAEFDIMFGGGISSEGDLLDLALADGLAEKTGAWFSYGQVRLGQGRENSKLFLRDNPDLAKELRQAIIAKRMPAPAPATSKAASGSAGEVAKPAAGKDKDTKEAGKAKAAAAAIAARKIARKG